MAINNYLKLITSEHRSQPKFISWLSAALQKVDDGMSMANSIPSIFDINNASGVQLDVIGQSVGAGRNVGIPLASGSSVLDDAHYQLLIRAKIAQNQWDGTIGQIYSLWASIFPYSTLQIIDNQNMTMQAVVTGMTDVISQELVNAGLIIPKPAGVALTIIERTNISDTAYFGSVVSGQDSITITTQHP